MAKRKVRVIKVNLDVCNGCRACEVVCSAFHANPKFSTTNPGRSRIRVHFDPFRNVFVPVLASAYTAFECPGRNRYSANGTEYDECAFCGVSCPSRDLFKEPDSGLPLKCDMCEQDPPLEEPMCVKWCLVHALTYEEREEEVEEAALDELETGMESLVDRFGPEKVMDSLARILSGKGYLKVEG